MIARPQLQKRAKKMAELPRNSVEMMSLLFQAGIVRAYEQLATAAWKGRLTNSEIDRIERGVIDMLAEANEAAEEFRTFEMEKCVADARAGLRLIFAGARKARDEALHKG